VQVGEVAACEAFEPAQDFALQVAHGFDGACFSGGGFGAYDLPYLVEVFWCHGCRCCSFAVFGAPGCGYQGAP